MYLQPGAVIIRKIHEIFRILICVHGQQKDFKALTQVETQINDSEITQSMKNVGLQTSLPFTPITGCHKKLCNFKNEK